MPKRQKKKTGRSQREGKVRQASGVRLPPEILAHLRRVGGLVTELRALASKEIVMPVEEIRLAAQLADEAGQDRLSQESVVFPLMVLAHDENFHIRRVAINAFRRIGRFDVAGLLDLLINKLDDPHPWVRYDAVWAIESAGTSRRDAIQALRKLADGMKALSPQEEQKMDQGNASLRARLKAAQALQKITRR